MKSKIPFIAAAFAIGGLGYAGIELLWRGRTHWSMMITGGLCMTIMLFIFRKHGEISLVYSGLIGSAVITIVELFAGCIVNVWLGLKIWDYSNQPLNFMGQICPLYSLLWCMLSIPVSQLCVWLNSLYDSLQTIKSR